MSKLVKEINREIQNRGHNPNKPTIIVSLKKHNFSKNYEDYINERMKFDKYFKKDFNKPFIRTFYYDIENADLDFITNINKYDFTTHGRSLLTNWVRGEDFDYYIENIELIEYRDETNDFTLDDLKEL